MSAKSVRNTGIFLFSIFIILGLASPSYSQERDISGIINNYHRVISFADKKTAVIDNVSGIIPGDTVLVIQMKGTIVYQPESASFGEPYESEGSPGQYEFLIVASVNAAGKSVTFTNNIKGKFNAKGVIQLIIVPSYRSVRVSGTLTCAPWDSTLKTGGVLAFMVKRRLTLNAGIDVSGKGFAGGSVSPGQGICQATDVAQYDKFSYPLSYGNSGMKGESQVTKVFLNLTTMPSYFPVYTRGKGKNLTGGGGGNGRYSGGGGGSNYGAGGKGGRESITCTPYPGDGGIGGRTLNIDSLAGRIFAGGGGGSSTYESGSAATAGGRGGGIVIIICDTLKANGNSVKADGLQPSGSASGNAGAGGGGGGGSVAIWLHSFGKSALSVSAAGGKGGNTSASFGEGGGGGGGMIAISSVVIPSNVVMTTTGGTGGTRTGGSTSGTAGTQGSTLSNFAPVISGFLFNFVYSSGTLDQSDSICSGTIPPRIKGTQPAGGIAPYTYKWEKSYNKNFSSSVTLANNPDSVNYSPVLAETSSVMDTVWFRRTVTDASTTNPWTDVSEPVTFVIQPVIKNNTIEGAPDTICYGTSTHLIQSLPDLLTPLPNPAYAWQDSSSAASWGPVKAFSKEFTPVLPLTTTFWFRRKVASGRCTDISNSVRVTVLPQIKNTLTGINNICYGLQPDSIRGDRPSFGAFANRLAWQDSLDGSSWSLIPGISTSAYKPPVLYNTTLFRRITYLGNNDLCRDTSLIFPIKVNLLPAAKITSSPDTSICDGAGTQIHFKVHLTGKSKWTMIYSVNSSDSPSIRIAGSDTTINVASGTVTDSLLYRIYPASLKDGNGCNAVSFTDTLKAHVYSTPSANAGTDATICGAIYKLQAVKSVGSGQWSFPAGASAPESAIPTATVTIDSSYNGGNISHYFFWKESNGKCSSRDSVLVTFYKRVNRFSIKNDTLTIVNSFMLDEDPLKSWETANWSVVTGTGKVTNESSNSTLALGLSEGLNSFQWNVTNGDCHSADIVRIILQNFIPKGFSPNADDLNDAFVIDGLDPNGQSVDLIILDGAGQEVYSASKQEGEANLSWDGTDSKGKTMADGTYYYLLKITVQSNGQVFRRKGFIVLKRN